MSCRMLTNALFLLRKRRGVVFLLSLAALSNWSSGPATAQFYVHEIQTVDGGGALNNEQLNRHYEAYHYLINPTDLNILDFDGALVDSIEDQFDQIDFAGNGGGTFAVNNPVLGAGGNDFAIEARAKVTIPAGTWQIAFGSDDGGQLTLADVSFGARFGENFLFPAEQRSNQIWFNDNRGHAWTGASFTLTAPLTTIFHSSFHERGGGDSFEVAIRNASSGLQTGVNATDWVLLEDGALGWDVAPTQDLPHILGSFPAAPASINGVAGALREVTPPAGVIFNTTGDGTTMMNGVFNQLWVAHNNSGNLNANLDGLVNNGTRLNIQDSWWTGNAGAQLDTQNYPQPIIDSTEFPGAGAGNQESYTVWSSGEIDLPAGDVKFRHGVDDYKYLAVDFQGNGTAGDQPGEVLYNDNEWVNWDGTRADGDVTKVAGGTVKTAGWTKVEFIMSEGGGGDAGTLYWDVGNKDLFPDIGSFNSAYLQGEGKTFEDFLVPANKMRTVARGALGSVGLQAALDGATVNLEVSSDLVDADHVQLRNANFSTTLDVSGATVNVSVLGGDLVVGDEFVLFDASTITGQSGVNWNLPGGNDKWDVSGFSAGTTNRIKYTGGLTDPLDCNGDGSVTIADADCNCDGDLAALLTALGTLNGDADGDKQVQFPDFVILANNFGKAGTFTKGDFDCDGTVQFPDFVILANNFGKTGAGAAAAVPEPSSLTLIGLAGLMLGFARRRRS